MVTIYEFGHNTNDSILGNFGYTIGFSGNGTIHEDSLSGDGLGFYASYEVSNMDDGMLHLFKSLPDMALYSDLEFQIEYTVYPSNYDLSLFVANDFMFSSEPNVSGTLVESSVISMATIPYTNVGGDSVLKLEIYLPLPDSVVIDIDYIRISADTSTHVSISEANAGDFLIYSNDHNIEIIPSENDSKYQVFVYNISGQEVYQNEEENASQISLHNESGIYIVKVVSDRKVWTKKVVLP